MENFISKHPTILYFGKDVISNLSSVVNKTGKRVLLVYGKESVKKNGIYKKVYNEIIKGGCQVFEYSGIKSNPLIEDVDQAAETGRTNKTDIVIALGGGSVIDSAKVIALTIPVNHSGWEFMDNKIKPQTALPLISILTLAATGSETNRIAVLQSHKEQRKTSVSNDLLYPRYAFLDPQFTYSVPSDYTAYGIADLIAHCLEAWFGGGEATLSDRFIISIIKEAMEYGPLLLKNLQDYELRAKIMFAANVALDGSTMRGKINGDFGVHNIGHILSLLYDIPHGASLTIVYPAWLDTIKKRTERVEKLGKELFNSADNYKTIELLKNFFKSINCPISLNEMGISEIETDNIFNLMLLNKVNGSNFKLNDNDYKAIISKLF